MCIRQSEYLLLAREIWPRSHARTPSCAPCPTRARASCATSTRHAPRPCLSPASPCQFISTVHTGGAGPEHTPLDPGAPSRRSIPALHLGAPIWRSISVHALSRSIVRRDGVPSRQGGLGRVAFPCRSPFGNRARRPWPIQGGRLGPAPPAQAYAASFGLRACTL